MFIRNNNLVRKAYANIITVLLLNLNWTMPKNEEDCTTFKAAALMIILSLFKLQTCMLPKLNIFHLKIRLHLRI